MLTSKEIFDNSKVEKAPEHKSTQKSRNHNKKICPQRDLEQAIKSHSAKKSSQKRFCFAADQHKQYAHTKDPGSLSDPNEKERREEMNKKAARLEYKTARANAIVKTLD